MKTPVQDPIILKQIALNRFNGNAAALARMVGVSRQAAHMWGETLPPLQAWRLDKIYPDLKHRLTTQ